MGRGGIHPKIENDRNRSSVPNSPATGFSSYRILQLQDSPATGFSSYRKREPKISPDTKEP
jgi:hypothetical protein